MASLNVRADFPALTQKVNGKELVYLDSAATTLKPMPVIDRLHQYHSFETANVHRGAHYLSDIGTEAYEKARQTIGQFINAGRSEEIVFTYGTTDGLNLLATCLGQQKNLKGKNIVVTEMEHHSNLVPWHLLAERQGLEVRAIPVTGEGDLDLEAAQKLIDRNTAIVSVVHISNTLGAVNDVKKICALAKQAGAVSVVDGAQSIACMPINVQDIGCDYFVFSGHKVFGPYGIGVLYGRLELLNALPPFRGGGSMIKDVQVASSTYLESPYRFEAGTPNIPGAIALGTAIQYVRELGFDDIRSHEATLLKLAQRKFSDLDGIQVFGNPKDRRNILSFSAEWGHHSDIGQLLNEQGIAIRAGHHCTQPLLQKFGKVGVARASFSIYSTEEDVEKLAVGLKKCKEILG